jgi:aryl-alcohol dehydrogenase-like predicted oxidoreductase
MRAIPSSGERIPAVGMGTRQFSDPAADLIPTLRETIRLFAEMGGKLVDTAPTYGRAEVVFGDIVEQLGVRNQLFLATKVSLRGENQREAGIRQIEQSFARLHTDVIDLNQVHNLRDIDIQLPILREMKQEGRVRYVGMTTSSVRQYDDFARYMENEVLDFVQLDYSLGQRRAEERLLPLALDRGMGVLVNLPFGRGRLFRRVGDRPLPEWAAEIDCTSWAQVFLKFIISHPAVTCPIPGTDKPEYVIDNLNAAKGRLPDAALRKRMVEYYDALPQA